MSQEKLLGGLNTLVGGAEAGPQLLLLHGVTRQIADLRPIFERLPPKWGWLAVDFPGHGKSPHASHDYLVRDYTDSLAPLLETLDRRPLILLGNSLGAMVAAEAAARWPDRIAAAILEEPPFSTMGDRINESSFDLQFQNVSQLLKRRLPADELFAELREISVRRPSDRSVVRFGDLRDDASLRTYASYLAEVDPRILDTVVAGRWLEGYDFEAIAAQIACPVLLLQGAAELGGMLTDDEARRFTRAARNCRLKKFDNAGHLIHAGAPDALVDEITRFLAEAQVATP